MSRLVIVSLFVTLTLFTGCGSKNAAPQGEAANPAEVAPIPDAPSEPATSPPAIPPKPRIDPATITLPAEKPYTPLKSIFSNPAAEIFGTTDPKAVAYKFTLYNSPSPLFHSELVSLVKAQSALTLAQLQLAVDGAYANGVRVAELKARLAELTDDTDRAVVTEKLLVLRDLKNSQSCGEDVNTMIALGMDRLPNKGAGLTPEQLSEITRRIVPGDGADDFLSHIFALYPPTDQASLEAQLDLAVAKEAEQNTARLAKLFFLNHTSKDPASLAALLKRVQGATLLAVVRELNVDARTLPSGMAEDLIAGSEKSELVALVLGQQSGFTTYSAFTQFLNSVKDKASYLTSVLSTVNFSWKDVQDASAYMTKDNFPFDLVENKVPVASAEDTVKQINLLPKALHDEMAFKLESHFGNISQKATLLDVAYINRDRYIGLITYNFNNANDIAQILSPSFPSAHRTDVLDSALSSLRSCSRLSTATSYCRLSASTFISLLQYNGTMGLAQLLKDFDEPQRYFRPFTKDEVLDVQKAILFNSRGDKSLTDKYVIGLVTASRTSTFDLNWMIDVAKEEPTQSNLSELCRHLSGADQQKFLVATLGMLQYESERLAVVKFCRINSITIDGIEEVIKAMASGLNLTSGTKDDLELAGEYLYDALPKADQVQATKDRIKDFIDKL